MKNRCTLAHCGENMHVCTKHPAARKPAGHVRCEPMLVLQTSWGFQERDRNEKKKKQHPQQSIIIPNKTVKNWFNTQLQFTKASDKLLLFSLFFFRQFLGWPSTKTFSSHLQPAMFPPGSEQAPLWWIIKLHGKLQNNTRSVSMSNVHEASAKLWVLLKRLNDDSFLNVILFIPTLHNFLGAGTSQACSLKI